MMRKLYFVMRMSGQWLVWRTGRDMPVASFYTRREARAACNEANRLEPQINETADETTG
jgi:hypothetical protein